MSVYRCRTNRQRCNRLRSAKQGGPASHHSNYFIFQKNFLANQTHYCYRSNSPFLNPRSEPLSIRERFGRPRRRLCLLPHINIHLLAKTSKKRGRNSALGGTNERYSLVLLRDLERACLLRLPAVLLVVLEDQLHTPISIGTLVNVQRAISVGNLIESAAPQQLQRVLHF